MELGMEKWVWGCIWVRGKHMRKGSWTPAGEGWLDRCQFEETSRTWSLELISEEVSGIIDFICSSPAWLIHVSGHTHARACTHTFLLMKPVCVIQETDQKTLEMLSRTFPVPAPTLHYPPPPTLLSPPFLASCYSFFSFSCFLTLSCCSFSSSYSSPEAYPCLSVLVRNWHWFREKKIEQSLHLSSQRGSGIF